MSIVNQDIVTDTQAARNQKPNVVVFWKYDLFPFVLGGAAVINYKGDAFVKSYASWIRRAEIVAVLDLDVGLEKVEQLKSLRTQHQAEERKLLLRSKEQAIAILPELAEHFKLLQNTLCVFGNLRLHYLY